MRETLELHVRREGQRVRLLAPEVGLFTCALAEGTLLSAGLRAPQSGRFYHRPAPGEPAFADAGAPLADGQPIGLIEVMKTFTHVPYSAGAGLPARARLVRFVASDGGDVRQGDPLIEVGPA